MKAKVIEVRLGSERHRLVANENKMKTGCGKCSLFAVCMDLGQTSDKAMCDAMIRYACGYESVNDRYPDGGHFVEKK